MNVMNVINVCVVRKCKNKVLLVKNKNRNGWEFPGGKVDPKGDSIANGVFDIILAGSREYQEETEQPLSCGNPTQIYFNSGTNTVFLVEKKIKI